MCFVDGQTCGIISYLPMPFRRHFPDFLFVSLFFSFFPAGKKRVTCVCAALGSWCLLAITSPAGSGARLHRDVALRLFVKIQGTNA